jgi:hypothetical protein
LTHFKNYHSNIFFISAPRLDSGYASNPTNLASGACGYLQGITVHQKTNNKTKRQKEENYNINSVV